MSIKRFITLAIISISMLLLMLSVNIYQSREILELELELSHFNGQFFHQVENVLTCLFEL